VIVVATSIRVGIAVHTVSPKTGPGDVLGLVYRPESQAGSLAREIKSDQRINVLLMAYGGTGGDDPNFTDTMIVVSIRPASHKATLISLPRYLWVAIPAPAGSDVQGKLYSAYSLGASQNDQFLRRSWLSPTGAGDLAAATVSQTIGQPVNYWAAIDASAFEAVIDALGGVKVTVPEPLDDWNYQLEDSLQVTHIHFDAGPQVLDGRRAMEYARSRLSTSETDRSRRQELVLLGVLNSLRAPQAGVGILWSIGAIENGLRTNLMPLEIRELAQLVTAVKQDQVKQITMDDSDLLESKPLGTAEILVPRDGTYQAFQSYIASQLP
jgi:polyisoprenyl-teichoic acid--peptidoglycan teichoic acid transferase